MAKSAKWGLKYIYLVTYESNIWLAINYINHILNKRPIDHWQAVTSNKNLTYQFTNILVQNWGLLVTIKFFQICIYMHACISSLRMECHSFKQTCLSMEEKHSISFSFWLPSTINTDIIFSKKTSSHGWQLLVIK